MNLKKKILDGNNGKNIKVCLEIWPNNGNGKKINHIEDFEIKVGWYHELPNIYFLLPLWNKLLSWIIYLKFDYTSNWIYKFEQHTMMFTL